MADLLALVVLAVLGYAAFSHGATDLPAETHVQLALAAAALGAVSAGLITGRLSISTSRAGWAALGLLSAFAVWCAITLAWSVAPAGTWLETNRALTYALAVALGLVLGSSSARAIELIAVGWLCVGTAVGLFALGGKTLPWLHVSGLFDLDHTAVFSRVRAPLGYWNALALVCVLTVPVALRTVTDTARALWSRLLALGALQVLLTAVGLTYSRGGVLALILGAVVITALGGPRLRGLAALALAAVSAAPALAVAFTSHALTTDGESLSRRGDAGLLVALASVGGLAALLLGAWRLQSLESRHWSPAARVRVWRSIAVGAAALAIIAVGAAAVSSRGLVGSVDDQISNFTSVRKDPITDPSRLLSTSSGNRWVWWKEAAGAFSDRPLGGWGAGSFPVTHLLYRKPPPLPVSQPHSVPLQFLAETGVVGAVLALGAMLALLAAGLARVRSMVASRRRDLASAMVAAGFCWVVHGLFDWDWDIPGVTLPALVMLGVVAGRRAPRPSPLRLIAPGHPGRRVAALIPLSILLCTFAVSASLPAWAQTKSLDALTSASNARTPAALERAAADAELAARLNPLSDRGLLDAATVATRRGRIAEARDHLIAAAERNPYDASAWGSLANSAVEAGDRVGALRAEMRALALDPLNSESRLSVHVLLGVQVRPGLSATAIGTPLGP